MRLVFIHGPAASGKLTVAKELAALTGYPLFHNHLIVDALLAVFPFGSPSRCGSVCGSTSSPPPVQRIAR